MKNKDRLKVANYNKCGHNLLAYRYKYGYMAHSEEIERRIKRGMKQTQCKECGLYLFKDERSTDKKNIGVLPK